MSVVRYYLRLSGWERVAICRLFVLQCITFLLLRSAGLQRTRRWMAPRESRGRVRALPSALAPVAFAHRCHALSGAPRVLGWMRNNCLARSMALHRFLGTYGMSTTIRVGILPGSNPLQAHAWVEFGGEAIGGEDVAPFCVLPGLDAVPGVMS